MHPLFFTVGVYFFAYLVGVQSQLVLPPPPTALDVFQAAYEEELRSIKSVKVDDIQVQSDDGPLNFVDVTIDFELKRSHNPNLWKRLEFYVDAEIRATYYKFGGYPVTVVSPKKGIEIDLEVWFNKGPGFGVEVARTLYIHRSIEGLPSGTSEEVKTALLNKFWERFQETIKQAAEQTKRNLNEFKDVFNFDN